MCTKKVVWKMKKIISQMCMLNRPGTLRFIFTYGYNVFGKGGQHEYIK
jgi:hypothetical protein